MKKGFMALIIAIAFFATAIPAGAETVFNEMSKCIQDMGKGCCASKSGEAKTAAASPKATKTTDVLGNTVSTATDNSGKSKLGN